MIVRVWQKTVAACVGDVCVACDGKKIAEVVENAGGKAVLTDPDLPSGSDRIYQALTTIDPDKKYDVVVNVQGDMPTLDPAIIKKAVSLLNNPMVDIATLAAVITDEQEKNDPAVVKVVISLQSPVSSEEKYPVGRALSFSRTLLATDDWRLATLYHHIGIYAYRRSALERFVTLPPSDNEKKEKLEQLRAMDNGMRIDVAVVDTVPLGVDTPEGLERARRHYETI